MSQRVNDELLDYEATMRALSASEIACYKWPDDTPEHRALRAAYVEAAITSQNSRECPGMD